MTGRQPHRDKPRPMDEIKQEMGAARPHWIIDGRPYLSVKHAHSEAKRSGSLVSLATLRHRLAAGDTTWEALLRSTQCWRVEAAVSSKKATAQRNRDEMAELIASLDQRKRDMEKGE